MTLLDASSEYTRALHGAVVRPHLRYAVLTPANSNRAETVRSVPKGGLIAPGRIHLGGAAHTVSLFAHENGDTDGLA